jgi:hypothetical protein
MASDPHLDFNWDAFLEQDFNTASNSELDDIFDEDILAFDPSALIDDFPDLDLQPITPQQQTDHSKKSTDLMNETSAATEKPIDQKATAYSGHPKNWSDQSWGSSVNNVEVPAAKCPNVARGQDATNMQEAKTTTLSSQSSDWIPDISLQILQLRKE